MKKLFYLAFAALAFAGCSDSNDDEVPGAKTTVIDFEGANLGAEGYIWGKPQARLLTDDDAEGETFGAGSLFFYDVLYSEDDASIFSFYTDYAGLDWNTDTWNGFVISNHTDMTTPGYVNDKSVYATSGADGSSQFAVAYYGAWTGSPYGTPLVRFATAVSPKSIAVANITYFYLYYTQEAASVADVKGVITGYNGETKSGEVKFVMADQASGTVQSGWETLDLSSLGTVTSMTFTVESEDTMCPYYFAIDNLAYEK